MHIIIYIFCLYFYLAMLCRAWYWYLLSVRLPDRLFIRNAEVPWPCRLGYISKVTGINCMHNLSRVFETIRSAVVHIFMTGVLIYRPTYAHVLFLR